MEKLDFIEKLNNTETPLEAEKVLEEIAQTTHINDNEFMNKIECICDFKQIHLAFDYKDTHIKANIEVGQEVYWGQDAVDGSLDTDGYYAGYVLGYGHVTEITKDSITIDTYGKNIEMIIFPGIRMLYMYLNADGIEIFRLDGSVINGSFIAGFTDSFPEDLKKSILNQKNKLEK